MYLSHLAILIFILFSSRIGLGAVNGKVEKQESSYSDGYKGATGLPKKRPEVEASKNPKIPIGLKFALNLSNTNFNKGYPKPVIPVETVWKSGFSGGVFLEVPIVNNIYIHQEYLYTYLRCELKTEEREFYLGYFSLPILLKLKIKSGFSLVAGPQVDVLVQAREHFNGNSLDIIHEVEERNIGVVVGVVYELSRNVGFEARFFQGLNHIGIRQNGLTREFKVEQFQLSVLYSPFK